MIFNLIFFNIDILLRVFWEMEERKLRNSFQTNGSTVNFWLNSEFLLSCYFFKRSHWTFSQHPCKVYYSLIINVLCSCKKLIILKEKRAFLLGKLESEWNQSNLFRYIWENSIWFIHSIKPRSSINIISYQTSDLRKSTLKFLKHLIFLKALQRSITQDFSHKLKTSVYSLYIESLLWIELKSKN